MALGRCQDSLGCGARVVVLVNFRFVLVRPESYFRNEDFCFRAGSQSSKGRVVTAGAARAAPEDIASPRSPDSRARQAHHFRRISHRQIKWKCLFKIYSVKKLWLWRDMIGMSLVMRPH